MSIVVRKGKREEKPIAKTLPLGKVTGGWFRIAENPLDDAVGDKENPGHGVFVRAVKGAADSPTRGVDVVRITDGFVRRFDEDRLVVPLDGEIYVLDQER